MKRKAVRRWQSLLDFMLLIAAIALVWFAIVSCARADAPPTPGWVTDATVTRVIDGDTVIVEIRRELRIRLLDCWAPESRSRDATEKERGLAAKHFVTDLITGRRVRVTIPVHSEDLSKQITLGRVLGKIWLINDVGQIDDQDLSSRIVAAGHATPTK